MPIPISNQAELQAIVNNPSGDYVLVNDIVCSGNFNPIGDNSVVFTGVLDGNGYTISGLVLVTLNFKVGLIGNNSGTIKNLRLEGTATSFTNSGSGGHYGGVAGRNNSTGVIHNCVVNIDFNGTTPTAVGNSAGGIAGQNLGSIYDCCVTNRVNMYGGNNTSTGGITGFNNTGATIRNCYVVADVGGGSYTGGLIGVNRGIVRNCFFVGSIINGTYKDGFIGSFDSGTKTDNYYNSSTATTHATYTEIAPLYSKTAPVYTDGTSPWDFITPKWIFESIEGTTYPVLAVHSTRYGKNYSSWLGLSTDWNYSSNWIDGVIPTSDSTVLIFDKTNMPIIPEGTIIKNIIQYSGEISTTNNFNVVNYYDKYDGILNIDESAIITNFTQYDGTLNINDYLYYTTYSIIGGTVNINYSGSGEVGDPYIINSLYDIYNIRFGLDKYYALGDDISLENIRILDLIGTRETPFTGNFNGGGYTISDLKINSSESFLGLFRSTTGATITNFDIANCSIGGYSNVGVIVGAASNTTITSINITGQVGGESIVGGLAGNCNGCSIGSCTFDGAIFANSICGGLIGQGINTSITNSDCNNINTTTVGSGGFVGIYESGAVSNTNWKRNIDNSNSSINGLGKIGISPVNASLPWKAVACSHDFVNQVALATNQVAYTSNDSGLTWTARANSLASLWKAVASNINRSYLAVVRESGGWLATTSDLVTWTRRTNGIPSNVTFTDVAMSNSGGVILATESPTNNRIYVSIDSGATFTARGWTYGYTSCAMNDIGSFMVVTPRQGNIPALYSTDYGVTWIEMGPPQEGAGNFYGTAVSFSGQVIHIASSIGVRTSLDFGRTWRITDIPCNRIRCSRDGKAVVTFNGTRVYYSTDFGESFLYKDLGLTITDIAMNRAELNKVVVTINNGFIQIVDLASGGVNLNSDNSEIPPTPIYDAEDLNNMRLNLSASYILMNDIDLSNFGNWTPIVPYGGIQFSGNFDGNGYAIKNMTVNHQGFGQHASLFGNNFGTISNLTLINPNVRGDGYMGALSGISWGPVINCHVIDGVVRAQNMSNAWHSIAGGLLGFSGSTVTNCTCSSSDINYGVAGASQIGGLIGWKSGGTVTNCFSNVQRVTANDGSATKGCGGLIGNANNTTVTNCGYMSYKNPANHVASGNPCGTIVGYAQESTINKCYSVNSILSGYSNNGTGGICGKAVSGTTISDCFTSNMTLTASSNLGGILGINDSSTVTNCFHDSIDNSQGTAVSAEQLKQYATFSGWDFGDYALVENEEVPTFSKEHNQWIGTGNWSDNSNWSKGRKPIANDIVIFNNSSLNNCTIDVPVEVKCIQIGLDYTGTITQNEEVVVSNSFVMQNGTYNQNASLIIKRIYLQQGGEFNQDASFLTYGDATKTSGDFNKSGEPFTVWRNDSI